MSRMSGLANVCQDCGLPPWGPTPCACPPKQLRWNLCARVRHIPSGEVGVVCSISRTGQAQPDIIGVELPSRRIFVPPSELEMAGITRAEQDGVRLSKAPLDRLGEIPRALRALATQIAYGSTKPGRVPGDWRQCSREALIAKALRHLVDAASGEVIDDEGRSHLVAAMTDCALAVELEGKP